MWISVETKMPEIGVEVYVAGDYIPADTGNPTAHRCRCSFRSEEHWESREWRGTVAVRFWWSHQVSVDDNNERFKHESTKGIEKEA